MSAAKPLDYADRCERYARQWGWKYDPHQMSIGHLTPAQKRRALKKERHADRKTGGPWSHDSYKHETVIVDYDDYYQGDPHDLGYCVTPGCNCCDGDD